VVEKHQNLTSQSKVCSEVQQLTSEEINSRRTGFPTNSYQIPRYYLRDKALSWYGQLIFIRRNKAAAIRHSATYLPNTHVQFSLMKRGEDFVNAAGTCRIDCWHLEQLCSKSKNFKVMAYHSALHAIKYQETTMSGSCYNCLSYRWVEEGRL